ncbi:ABC transporter substrate-binding protein [Nesterenkonia alba]|uniref:ABC transporter substrate-binding protein n=1 Tax=Nesterenkonia alba TaxID=515814 RepID=UPI0003B4CD41|nr:extracellular solute-binding protein [Nesterenkonia alba]
MRFKQALTVTGALSTAALLLSACAQGEAEGSDDDAGNGEAEDVTISFTWWGGDARYQNTQEMVDLFEEEYPHISVDIQYADWQGYWDQLATQAAAGDAPDVIQMDTRYLREYIENGVLLELDAVETSEYAEELLENGLHEGSLYALPVTSNSFALVTNEELFTEAGLELPDDETWTWEDFTEITAEISANTDGYGLGRPPGDAGLELWLRQHAGVNLVDGEGELSWQPEDAESYFDLLQQMSDSGALPSAEEVSEDRAAGNEQTFIGTGQAALSPGFDANAVGISAAGDLELTALRWPSPTGSSADAELFYRASMFFSVYSGSEHPEEAQLLVDFLGNNEEAGQIQLIERGIPGNETIRDLIRDDLDDIERDVLEYNESIADVATEPPPLPPEGYGAVEDIVFRYEEEFLFGRVSAAEAAEGVHREITEAIN